MKQNQNNHQSKDWALGLIMLFIVVIAWVSSSFLLNTIFDSNYYRKPIFITFCSVSSCSLYLFPLLKQTIKLYWKNGGHWDIQTAYKTEYYKRADHLSIGEQYDVILNEKYDNDSVESTQHDENEEIIPLFSIIKLSIIFCTLWFGANVTTNTSLSYTSVTSQTILSSTASFFTLFFGALLGIDSINASKFVGLIISFIGIIIIVTKCTISTNSNFKHISTTSIIIGNILALLGALIYGIYSTTFKRSVLRMTQKYSTPSPHHSLQVDVKLFLGFVGLFTLIGLWPILVLFNYTGWEPFEFKWDTKIITILILNSSITFLSDFCWAKAIILTTPLTVTVGLSFTIPLAMFGDFIFKGKPITIWYMIGAILIISSFVLINQNDEASLEGDAVIQAKPLKSSNNVTYGSIDV